MTINNFSCEKCKYSTNIKDCITKHYLTKKHLQDNVNSFACNSCEKTFKTQSGLCHHRHRCKKDLSDTSKLLKIVTELKESNDELKKSNKQLKDCVDTILIQTQQPAIVNNTVNFNF